MNKIEKLISELCSDGVKYMELGEVCEIKNGYTPSKAKSDFWDNGNIPWFRMEDIRKNGRILNDSIQHITQNAVRGGKLFPANSIIMSTTATIGEHALITRAFLMNQQLTSFSIKKEFENTVYNKFLFYYSFVIGELCKKNVNPGGFALIGVTKIKTFKIPIPPLSIQKEIVKILDNFTQLEAELEAELEARGRQYEYYRNELLTFKELEK